MCNDDQCYYAMAVTCASSRRYNARNGRFAAARCPSYICCTNGLADRCLAACWLLLPIMACDNSASRPFKMPYGAASGGMARAALVAALLLGTCRMLRRLGGNFGAWALTRAATLKPTGALANVWVCAMAGKFCRAARAFLVVASLMWRESLSAVGVAMWRQRKRGRAARLPAIFVPVSSWRMYDTCRSAALSALRQWPWHHGLKAVIHLLLKCVAKRPAISEMATAK